jgi:RHS repeat-associated protein
MQNNPSINASVGMRSTSDYSPFGVGLDGRTSESEGYRYGFQGQELDDEIKGAGNSVNYKYRMHDPRVGRFFAVDPLNAKYPHNSPYAFSENRVIDGLELEGLEVVITHEYNKETNTFVKTSREIDYGFQQNVNRYIYKDENGNITRDVYKSWDTEPNRTEFISPARKASMYEVYKRFSDPWPEGFGDKKGYTVNSYEGPRGFKEKGAPLILATIGTIFSGGTLLTASGVVATSSATVGFVFSVDDMLSIDRESTILQGLALEVGGETAVKVLDGAKFAFSVKGAAKGFVNVTATLVDGSNYQGVYEISKDVFKMIKATNKVQQELENRDSITDSPRGE